MVCLTPFIDKTALFSRIHGLRRTTKTVDLKTWPASCGGEAKRINFLEHVVLQLSLNFTLRKNIEVEVISPGGTKSIILRSGILFIIQFINSEVCFFLHSSSHSFNRPLIHPLFDLCFSFYDGMSHNRISLNYFASSFLLIH